MGWGDTTGGAKKTHWGRKLSKESRKRADGGIEKGLERPLKTAQKKGGTSKKA